MSPRVLVALGLFGLAVFVLRDVLFFGEAFFERDLAWLYFPEVESFVRAVAEGALPLRDPSIGFGQPILASPDTQVLYPLAWLHLVLLPERAYSLMVLAHFLIGASGAAALCWRMSRSTWSAFFAGAFWMASGPFQSTLNLWHHFAGASWMPWVLVAFDRLLERPDARRTLVLGGLFGLQILAGSADLCAMSVLLAVIRLLTEGRAVKAVFPRNALMLGAALGLAVSLGAGVWLPALEVVQTSGRSALTRESRTEWSVHPLVATELILPTQIGALPLSPESSRRLTDGRPPLLKSLFLGTLIVPLLAAGMLNSAIPRKYRAFLAAGLILGTLGAIGRYSPAYDFMVAILPPLRLFRFPVKATLAVSLMASVLAGLGIRSIRGGRERFVVAGVSLLMLLLNGGLATFASGVLAPFVDPSAPAQVAEAIAKTASGLRWSALVLAGLAVSTVLGRIGLIRLCAVLGIGVTLFINREINFTISREIMRFRPDHVALLHDREPSRLYTFPYLLYPDRLPEVLAPRSPIPAESFIVLIRSALMAPIGGIWNLEYAWDYDQKALLDRTLAGLTTYMNQAQRPPSFLRLLQIANVTRIADFYPSTEDGLVLENTIPIVGIRPLYIYRVSGALPRAYAVSGARRLTLLESQAAILDPRFDPHAEVALTEGAASPISPTFVSTVAVTERRSDRISLDATLSEAGQVVLVEGFLPGWQASVDGVAVPVRRANALFLAAETPAGRHRVVFTYRPLSALLGIGLTAITAAGLMLALAGLRSRATEP